MIADTGLAIYHFNMAVDEWQETQTAFVRYIQREGKGAKTVLATLGECSTDTVDRFEQGKEIVSSTFVKFRQALIKRGYLDPALVAEEQAEYGPKTIPLDFKCPDCGEMTPGPPTATFCMRCGHVLGAQCPKCGNLNKLKANICDDCGTPLTEEGVKIIESIARATETRKERLDRNDSEKEQRRKDRKKRGIPEV